MKTLTVNVYGINELSADVKAKVLEQYRYYNVEFNGWFEPMHEGFIEKLKEHGFTATMEQIHFSGFGSQGDGVSFDGEIDETKFITDTRILALFNNGWINLDITKNDYSNHYCHENTRQVEYNIQDAQRADYPRIEDILYVTKGHINDLRKQLCREYYNDLEQYYYRLISDEQVSEALEENDFTFLEDGTVVNV